MPGKDLNPGNGKRQAADSGSNTLDHSAVRADLRE